MHLPHACLPPCHACLTASTILVPPSHPHPPSLFPSCPSPCLKKHHVFQSIPTHHHHHPLTCDSDWQKKSNIEESRHNIRARARVFPSHASSCHCARRSSGCSERPVNRENIRFGSAAAAVATRQKRARVTEAAREKYGIMRKASPKRTRHAHAKRHNVPSSP